MASLFERSFLMALGAAVLTKEMAAGLAEELVKKGESTGEEGKKVIEETVEQAREETRTLKTRFDETLQRNFHEMGLVTADQLEDLQLKLAQLEHRLSLLEKAASARPVAPELETPSGATPEEVSEAYHHFREEEVEVEALNPHLDVP